MYGLTKLVRVRRPQTIPPLPNTFIPDIWFIIFESFHPPDALEPFDFERNWPQDERWWHQQLVEGDLAMGNLARVSRGSWQISSKHPRDHGIEDRRPSRPPSSCKARYVARKTGLSKGPAEEGGYRSCEDGALEPGRA